VQPSQGRALPEARRRLQSPPPLGISPPQASTTTAVAGGAYLTTEKPHLEAL
jgi:hypothetical protein